MKKQFFTLFLLIFTVLSANCQWTFLRSLPTGEYPSTFDGVGYASMKFGLCGKTNGSTQSQTRTVTVYQIDETNGSLTSVYTTSDYGVSGKFMVSEKKLGKVFRFGNYQGFPSTHVLDSAGIFSTIGIHPQGFTICFSAFDENHLYSIFMNEYEDFILHSMINGVSVKVDTFTTFTPQKIDFPAPNCGYMSIIENGTNTHKILKSSSDFLNWNTIYETTNTISDIVFDEVNTGYAIVVPGMIIKTTDGGISWDTIYNSTNNFLNKIDVVNESIVFACGDNGIILRSINGGLEWTQDVLSTTSDLTHIIMFDENNGYAMSNNICYRLTNSTLPVVESTTQQFRISPNPSNGETSFISNSLIKSIEIIDINGKILYSKVVNDSHSTLTYYPNEIGNFLVRVTFNNGEIKTEKLVFVN